MHGDFIIRSATRIKLPEQIFMNGPWFHLATITRGLQEYVALLHQPSGKVYFEEITALGHFKHIEDNQLWNDLIMFANSNNLVGEAVGKETVVGHCE